MSDKKLYKIEYTIVDGMHEYGDSMVCKLPAEENTIDEREEAACKEIFDFFIDDDEQGNRIDALDAFTLLLIKDGQVEIEYGMRVIKDMTVTEIKPIQIIMSGGMVRGFKGLPHNIEIELLDYKLDGTAISATHSNEFPLIEDRLEGITLSRIIPSLADWELMKAGTITGWHFDRECTQPAHPSLCREAMNCDYNVGGSWESSPPKVFPCVAHTSWINVPPIIDIDAPEANIDEIETEAQL